MCCRRHPQVIQLRLFTFDNERVEAEQLAFAFGDINRIGGDELRRDCQIVLPVFQPMVG